MEQYARRCSALFCSITGGGCGVVKVLLLLFRFIAIASAGGVDGQADRWASSRSIKPAGPAAPCSPSPTSSSRSCSCCCLLLFSNCGLCFRYLCANHSLVL